jgi:hypothetical protein
MSRAIHLPPSGTLGLVGKPLPLPLPILQEHGWAPGTIWICAKNLAPTRIGSLENSAHIQLLYRLRYPGPIIRFYTSQKRIISSARMLMSIHTTL